MVNVNRLLKTLTGTANTIPSLAVSERSDMSGRVAAKPRAIRSTVQTISLAIFLFLSRSAFPVVSRIIFFGVFSCDERLELSELLISNSYSVISLIEVPFIRRAIDKDRTAFA